MPQDFSSQLCRDINASPTPRHCVKTVKGLLTAQGFVEQKRTQFARTPGKYFLQVGGTLMAWIQPERLKSFSIAAAHTDSPNLRVRPQPDTESANCNQLGVEVYGSPLLNSWLDRDLSLAGHVIIENGDTTTTTLVTVEEPCLHIPQLAIHLDRTIKSKGLQLDPQKHLTPMWYSDAPFRSFLAKQCDTVSENILSFDMQLFDTQKASIVGLEKNILTSSRIDNQLSVFCATYALLSTAPLETVCPVAFFYDHEEVGSQSAIGAAGNLAANTLEQIAYSCGLDRTRYLAALASSFLLSIDGAHATHPNYADKHDSQHHIALNGGLVIKQNVNQRYATSSETAAYVTSLLKNIGQVPQRYSHRNDIPCGSTIGPIASANLAIATADIGVGQLAMHSIRETAGLEDAQSLVALCQSFWQ